MLGGKEGGKEGINKHSSLEKWGLIIRAGSRRPGPLKYIAKYHDLQNEYMQLFW